LGILAEHIDDILRVRLLPASAGNTLRCAGAT